MTNNRRFYKDIFFFALANFLWPLGCSMYINFFPIHIRQLGGSELVVGLTVSIPFFAGILCLLGGMLADFTDRKKIIFFGWAITIPAPLIWAFADRWEWLLVGTVVYSFTMVCAPAITLYIFDYETIADKMQAFSLYSISGMLGSILGPSIGGIILESYGTQVLYLLIFLFYTAATLCVLPMSQQPKRTGRNIRQYLKWDNLAAASSVKRLTVILLFLALISFIQHISGPYMPLFLNEVKQLPVDRIGLAFTVLSLGAALFTWLFGKFDGTLGMHKNLLIAIVLFLLSIAITAYAGNIYWLLLAFFLRGVVGATLAYTLGSVASRLTGENKGLLLSLFIALRNILIGVAAYPGAFLYPIHPYLFFYVEGILLAVWAALSFHTYFRGFWKK